MIESARILSFAAVSLAIALAPGPSWTFVIHSTVRQGRTAGFVAALGNATGIIAHALAAALGLSAIFIYSEAAFTAIKWLGALYLMFLAVRIIRGRMDSPAPGGSQPTRPLGKIYRDGVLVNLLNPKVSLLMLSLLPQFASPALGHSAFQIAALGSLHAVIASAVLATIVCVATFAAGILGTRPNFEVALRWFTGLLLFGFGAKLAWSESP